MVNPSETMTVANLLNTAGALTFEQGMSSSENDSNFTDQESPSDEASVQSTSNCEHSSNNERESLDNSGLDNRRYQESSLLTQVSWTSPSNNSKQPSRKRDRKTLSK